MPKREIVHKAGQIVSEDVRWIVDKFFDSVEIDKIQRLGGRILISIATPYHAKHRKEILINEMFIDELKSKRDNVDEVREKLDGLTVRQLREICSLIQQPIPSDATSEEIKVEVLRRLQADDYWRGISGKEPSAGKTD